MSCQKSSDLHLSGVGDLAELGLTIAAVPADKTLQKLQNCATHLLLLHNNFRRTSFRSDIISHHTTRFLNTSNLRIYLYSLRGGE